MADSKETQKQAGSADKTAQQSGSKAEQQRANHSHEGNKFKDYLKKEEHKFGDFMKTQEKEADTDNDKYAGLM